MAEKIQIANFVNSHWVNNLMHSKEMRTPSDIKSTFKVGYTKIVTTYNTHVGEIASASEQNISLKNTQNGHSSTQNGQSLIQDGQSSIHNGQSFTQNGQSRTQNGQSLETASESTVSNSQGSLPNSRRKGRKKTQPLQRYFFSSLLPCRAN